MYVHLSVNLTKYMLILNLNLWNICYCSLYIYWLIKKNLLIIKRKAKIVCEHITQAFTFYHPHINKGGEEKKRNNIKERLRKIIFEVFRTNLFIQSQKLTERRHYSVVCLRESETDVLTLLTLSVLCLSRRILQLLSMDWPV